MSSFFNLELDTTGPEVEITAPNYVLPNVEMEIRIESNEGLLNKQTDIYILDAQNIRHELVWQHNETGFVVTTTFKDFALGIAQVVVRVCDTVFNPSEEVVRTIDVKQAAEIHAEALAQVRSIVARGATRRIVGTAKTRGIDIVDCTRVIVVDENERRIEVNSP